jgi:hypothetical protein
VARDAARKVPPCEVVLSIIDGSNAGKILNVVSIHANRGNIFCGPTRKVATEDSWGAAFAFIAFIKNLFRPGGANQQKLHRRDKHREADYRYASLHLLHQKKL